MCWHARGVHKVGNRRPGWTRGRGERSGGGGRRVAVGGGGRRSAARHAAQPNERSAICHAHQVAQTCLQHVKQRAGLAGRAVHSRVLLRELSALISPLPHPLHLPPARIAAAQRRSRTAVAPRFAQPPLAARSPPRSPSPERRTCPAARLPAQSASPPRPTSAAAAGGRRAAAAAYRCCGRRAAGCWAARRPSPPPCWRPRPQPVRPAAAPRWRRQRRRARRAPRRRLRAMAPPTPRCVGTGAGGWLLVRAVWGCPAGLRRTATIGSTPQHTPVHTRPVQAKALDSVLKEINSRFGKNSIMKLGTNAVGEV